MSVNAATTISYRENTNQALDLLGAQRHVYSMGKAIQFWHMIASVPIVIVLSLVSAVGANEHDRIVADFTIYKTCLFSKLCLTRAEYLLFLLVYTYVRSGLPKPDFLIFLRAPMPILMHRIQGRGREMEAAVPSHYIQRVQAAYSGFYQSFGESPKLAVDSSKVNFATDHKQIRRLSTLIAARLNLA